MSNIDKIVEKLKELARKLTIRDLDEIGAFSDSPNDKKEKCYLCFLKRSPLLCKFLDPYCKL